MSVSLMSTAGMVFTLLISIGLPVLLLALVKHRTGHGFLAATVGAACFIIFAMILEQFLHVLVIPHIANISWLYVLYACLAAGLFEETGRLAGLLFLNRKQKNLGTGFAYGVGHGGIEAILVAGTASIANLMFVFSYTGAASMKAMAEVMKTTPSHYFWVGGLERVFAIAIHIALSILIWMVVTKRLPFWFYPVAIGLHALVNLGAALSFVGAVKSIMVVEAYSGIVALGICLFVLWNYRRTRTAPVDDALLPQEPAPVEPPQSEDAAPPQE